MLTEKQLFNDHNSKPSSAVLWAWALYIDLRITKNKKAKLDLSQIFIFQILNVKEYLNSIYCCFNFLFDKFQWSSPDFFRNVLHSFFVSNVFAKTRSDSYISGSHSVSSLKNKGFGSQLVPNTSGTNCYFSLAKYGWYRNSSTFRWSSGPYISHIGMCCPKGYGSCAVLVWKRV